jgi:hypothetical protein
MAATATVEFDMTNPTSRLWLIGLLLSACAGNTASPAGDSSANDVGVDAGSDAAATDSAATDSAAPDTAATDSAAPDTAATDASAVDAAADAKAGDDSNGGCAKGCDDGDPCTDDTCVAGACQYSANAAPCDDKVACTSDDACNAGTCAGLPQYWQATFGGSGQDVGTGAHVLDDGGLIVVGHTNSKGKGGRDAWLLRIDVHGALVWDQVLGNDLDQTAYDVARFDGKSGAVGAWREHSDNRPRGWLHVFDADGKTVASHVFALAEITELHAISVGAASKKPTLRMVVAGYAEDDAGDIALAVGSIDPTTLAPQWVKHYGDSGFDVAWDVVLLFNGHIATVGDTALPGVGGGLDGPHVQLIELDEDGVVAWKRTYFSDGEDTGWSLVSDPDPVGQNKGFTVGGSRKSPGKSASDAWLMHTNDKGELQWQQTATAPGGAGINAVARMSGGYLAAGDLAKVQNSSEAALWRSDTTGTTTWTLAAGNAGARANASLVWNDAVGLVGQSASGKAADLLVVRASLAGKATCPP